MRKAHFAIVPPGCVNLFCLLALAVAPQPTFGQGEVVTKEAPIVNSPLPGDPKALLLLAANLNGLAGSEVQSWHLRATYKLLDEEGKTKDQGTFEEFFVSPTKNKEIFQSASYTQTTYETEKGLFSSGTTYLPSYVLTELRQAIVDPVPNPQLFENEQPVAGVSEAFGVKLNCIRLNKASTFLAQTFCLDTDKPIVRVIEYPLILTQCLYDRAIAFRGRAIAGDLRFLQAGKLVLSAHLDTVEPLTVIKDSDFSPPPDATRVPRVMFVPEQAGTGTLIKKVPPVYPDIAKQENVTGLVLLGARIGQDGHIAALYVISGPAMLQQAALDAVRHWVYKPVTRNGESFEVSTVIRVIFMLGSHR